MNSTLLPAQWTRATRPGAGLRVDGSEVMAAQGATWHLQRRCSLSPTQLGAAFGVVLVVSMAVAAGFWWAGAPLVTAFAGLEVLLVAAGFAWHAVHAADGERLQLADGQLTIDVRRGLRLDRLCVDAAWLHATAARDGAIELRTHGRSLRVGAHADTATNRRVVNELSLALSAMRRSGQASQ